MAVLFRFVFGVFIVMPLGAASRQFDEPPSERGRGCFALVLSHARFEKRMTDADAVPLRDAAGIYRSWWMSLLYASNICAAGVMDDSSSVSHNEPMALVKYGLQRVWSFTELRNGEIFPMCCHNHKCGDYGEGHNKAHEF